MKLRTLISLAFDRYEVQLEPYSWTENETNAMMAFGEPLVDVGGVITGTVSRPGQTNTTVAITGGGGSGATASVVITAGAITGYTILSGGTGYTSVPAVAITGDGAGAMGLAVLTSGVLTSITVAAGGVGYNAVPTTVNFTLSSALRRMRSDFPIKEVFDLRDDPNSDVKAQVYAAIINARLIAARNTLIAGITPFLGETVVTV